MEKKFNFQNLFTFEMANNHQGSVEHGLHIIKECADIAKEFNIRAAVKLQLRNLDTLIHPAYRHKKNIKHIPRFLSTALSQSEFRILVEATKKHGLITMATPFDEDSVALHDKLGIEIIKVASCSCTDWPLLEKVAVVGKPIIVPPEPGLMGAFGVALEVKKRIANNLIEEGAFDLQSLAAREVTYGKSFTCGGGKEK